jgi:hypothetical protein
LLGAHGLWAGRDFYRATLTVTWGIGFSGLIRRTAPSSRLLIHAWGCEGTILTWILTVVLRKPIIFKENALFRDCNSLKYQTGCLSQYAYLHNVVFLCTKFHQNPSKGLEGVAKTKWMRHMEWQTNDSGIT